MKSYVIVILEGGIVQQTFTREGSDPGIADVIAVDWDIPLDVLDAIVHLNKIRRSVDGLPEDGWVNDIGTSGRPVPEILEQVVEDYRRLLDPSEMEEIDAELDGCEHSSRHQPEYNEHGDCWCLQCGERLLLPGTAGYK